MSRNQRRPRVYTGSISSVNLVASRLRFSRISDQEIRPLMSVVCVARAEMQASQHPLGVRDRHIMRLAAALADVAEEGRCSDDRSRELARALPWYVSGASVRLPRPWELILFVHVAQCSVNAPYTSASCLRLSMTSAVSNQDTQCQHFRTHFALYFPCFYRASTYWRDARYWYNNLSVRPSVCSSVCPLRSGIRWKRLNISSQFFFHRR